MRHTIDLQNRSKEDLLIIAVNACDALCRIANNLTTDEGDVDDTEEEFGLDAAEVVGMAHDGMIRVARSAGRSPPMTVRIQRRLYHYGAAVRDGGGVRALCAKTDRPIDLKAATWTIREEVVTCPRCRRRLREEAEAAITQLANAATKRR